MVKEMYNKKIPQYGNYSDGVKGKMLEKVILDEFFFFENYDRFFENLFPALTPNAEVYIFSSFKDPIKDYNWISEFSDMNNIVVNTLTENYRLKDVMLTVDNETVEFKLPRIAIEEVFGVLKGNKLIDR